MMRCLFVVLLVIGLSGCQKESGPSPDEMERVTNLGREASEALMQGLGSQLKAALQAGGPVSAMQACQQIAPLSTVAIGKNYEGVTIRRTALKVRNPKNAPDSWDQKVLDRSVNQENLPSEIIEWTEAAARYYKPLYVQEICLKCHGDPGGFSPELKSALGMLYPDDQATGYDVGDFRGFICVEVVR